MTRILAVVKEPGRGPHITHIKNNEDSIEALLGGERELVHYAHGVDFYANKWRREFSANVRLNENMINGDIVAVAVGATDFIEMLPEQLDRVLEMLSEVAELAVNKMDVFNDLPVVGNLKGDSMTMQKLGSSEYCLGSADSGGDSVEKEDSHNGVSLKELTKSNFPDKVLNSPTLNHLLQVAEESAALIKAEVGEGNMGHVMHRIEYALAEPYPAIVRLNNDVDFGSEILSYNLMPGTITCLQADKSKGKSCISMGVAIKAILAGKKVFYIVGAGWKCKEAQQFIENACISEFMGYVPHETEDVRRGDKHLSELEERRLDHLRAQFIHNLRVGSFETFEELTSVSLRDFTLIVDDIDRPDKAELLEDSILKLIKMQEYVNRIFFTITNNQGKSDIPSSIAQLKYSNGKLSQVGSFLTEEMGICAEGYRVSK